MYQADFICTYKLMDNEYDQEQLYRIQLLQAFDLNEWNDYKINEVIADLYKVLNNILKDVFIKARMNKNIIEMLDILKLSDEKRLDENDIIFNLLFKFEYFDLLHRCLVDYLINDTIAEKYIQALLEEL
jgi:hypothetical protein